LPLPPGQPLSLVAAAQLATLEPVPATTPLPPTFPPPPGCLTVATLVPQDNLGGSIKLLGDARAVLERWEKAYMDMRQRIEDSGRDNRWEFDRQKLFTRTRYMAARCTDLLQVVEMLHDMRAMLGPELKSVTGNAAGINDVLERVEAAVVPIESVPFDLFDRRYAASWDAVMVAFRDSVAAIEACDTSKTISHCHPPALPLRTPTVTPPVFMATLPSPPLRRTRTQQCRNVQ